MIVRASYYYLLIILSFTAIYILTRFCQLRHLVLFYLLSVPLAILASLLVEKIGSGLGSFLSLSGRPNENPNEAFSGDIERARHSKRNGYFDQALDIIDSVIKNGCNSPDALFLKAQIQWEGFENAIDAKKNLRKVMELSDQNDTLHRWASNLYDDIVRAEKEHYQELLNG